MEKNTVDQLSELIEKHEEIHIMNEQIICKQKELIATLQQYVAELKEIIEKYLLKDVTL